MSEFFVVEDSQFEEMLRRAGTFAATLVLEQVHKQTPELMNKAELAQYLGCSISKINLYMKKGLPFEQFGDVPRYRKTDIDFWLKRK